MMRDKFWQQFRFYSPDGAGGGDGTQPPTEPNGNEITMTQEELDEKINKAVTSRLEREAGKLSESQVEERIQKALEEERRKSKMTQDELLQQALKDKDEEIARLTKSQKVSASKSKVQGLFSEAKIELTDVLSNLFVTEDMEQSVQNAQAYIGEIEKTRKTVKEEIKDKSLGNLTPGGTGSGGASATSDTDKALAEAKAFMGMD